MTFQDMVMTLLTFWAKEGCVIHHGHDLEVGAGTLNPVTFFRCLGKEHYSAVYVEPSRRPNDSRYGKNANRSQFYHQLQAIIKPSPNRYQEIFLESLEAVSISVKEHDIRFVADDWENKAIGAFGAGWEVWIDGMEVAQITYFQELAGIILKPVTLEISYGLERLALVAQDVDAFSELDWSSEVSYGYIHWRSELEWSRYNIVESNLEMLKRHFTEFVAEAERLVLIKLPIPAYDFLIKASHTINLLSASGGITLDVYFEKTKKAACLITKRYLDGVKEG